MLPQEGWLAGARMWKASIISAMAPASAQALSGAGGGEETLTHHAATRKDGCTTAAKDGCTMLGSRPGPCEGNKHRHQASHKL
eukprot:878264-Rhodomonas_salina.1